MKIKMGCDVMTCPFKIRYGDVSPVKPIKSESCQKTVEKVKTHLLSSPQPRESTAYCLAVDKGGSKVTVFDLSTPSGKVQITASACNTLPFDNSKTKI